eukprot:TRINITY_DN12203_c2_g4_i2.p1 TRINITY_DN12203_c2_g4~~TRINITY_DN12203_c2_g4_i2.p1  ORF type:complete len:294 (+),score=43.58 TRINITY_DN12203_c2_g4_i2:140-1021(+)
MLIGKGADMDAKNRDNSTPLHFACGCGHLAVAEMLIGKGADMQAKTKDNNFTPLHLACINGHLAVAEMLIGKGADMDAKNRVGKTPLDLCKSRKMRRHLKQAAASVQARAAPAPAAHGARAVRSSAQPSGASGHTAASPESRAAPVPAPARQSAPEHRPAPAAVNGNPDIFISLRFGEALPAAEALKAKLQAKGVSVFLCAVAAGGDLVDEIVENIDACRLVVILGTVKTLASAFAQRTSSSSSLERRRRSSWSRCAIALRKLLLAFAWVHTSCTTCGSLSVRLSSAKYLMSL